jgi:alpha-N-arabinofuranosidase
MDRPFQLNLDSAGVSRGLFAPAISFHEGKFYIVCTLIDKGGNFVISASDPAGPWSDPVWLKEVDGIDPSLFFDSSGRSYLFYNSIPPDNQPLYNGHRTIRMREFDFRGLKTVGNEKLIINGGTDISKKPVWIEAPHVYFVNGWYYLICAEGGTAYNHSEVVFRSKSIEGPYEVYSGNPILTQRHLDPNRPNPITTAGHADLVETPDGKWYAVFLACRPYKDQFYNTGRETFMAPLKWTNDGWPYITRGNETIQYNYPLPLPRADSFHETPYNGNFHYFNDFSNPLPDPRLIFLRTVRENWYSLRKNFGFITMKLRPETAGGKGNPSFIAHRQQHIQCTATTRLKFSPRAENEKAGIVVFQNEEHYYFLCISGRKSKKVVQLFRSLPANGLELVASIPVKRSKLLQLQIISDGASYSFRYKTGKDDWTILKDGVDGTFLSTSVAGGFVGTVFAMYATSSGKPTDTNVLFDFFEYVGNDEVFK